MANFSTFGAHLGPRAHFSRFDTGLTQSRALQQLVRGRGAHWISVAIGLRCPPPPPLYIASSGNHICRPMHAWHDMSCFE